MEGRETCVTIQESLAYEYLCHLQETKIWIESVLKENLPPITELEESLRNGVYLARIGHAIAPEVVPLSGIYDIFQHRYRACGLQFKHTDNINYWIKALNAVNFPRIFHPETTDIFDKKNMPKLIYCIHALSTHLFKLGIAPSVQDLFGRIEFNRDEIDTTCHELEKCGTQLPCFKEISGILINESDCDRNALHSFIMNTDDALSCNCSEKLLQCLHDPTAELVHVLPENINEYMKSLQTARQEKVSMAKSRCLRNGYEKDIYDELLTPTEIQGYIRRVNCDCLWREIQKHMKDEKKLKKIVQKIYILELKDFNAENVESYIEVIMNLETERLNSLSRNCLSREVMESIIKKGNRLYKERKRVSDVLVEVKAAVKNGKANNLLKALGASPLKLQQKVFEQNINQYLVELDNVLKMSGNLTYPDIKSTIESVNSRNSDDSCGEKSTSLNSSSTTISIECSVGGEINEINLNGLEDRVTSFQARIRGYLVRSEIGRRSISCKIQPYAKSDWGTLPDDNDNSINAEMSDFYIRHIDKIIKIQAFWRGYRVRKSLKSLSQAGNYPKFVLLRRMARMNFVNGHDYSEHLKLQTLRSSVVETIKKNQELACKLDEIDTKIGLLVHNKMLIQNLDVVGKKVRNAVTDQTQPKGIRSFSKETKTLLDGYGQLFYMLQTDPSYLTRLITRVPQESTNLIQNCVLPLFNYGSSTRDAYLLLRLFQSALVEEVKCKIQKPVDVIKGNPLVLRLALRFSRQYEGYNALRNILGFLIENVLNEKTCIDTNPVDIYRRWINKVETETGRSSNLPIIVTREEALSHPEVAEQLQHNLKILKMWVKTFLRRITASANKFPFALRFVGKILWKALREKFPETSEKDIMKIVGNLVFYQYINTAIVAPDNYYIISLPPNQKLNPGQMRNLASIAKILQFAAWKKGFGVESQHLMCLNSFIISCHEEMKLFCKKCFTIEDLEEHFNITKYTEAALIEKPKIYITLEEIVECHRFLYEKREHISTDPFDPIQEVLDTLGEPPSVADLVGCSRHDEKCMRSGKIQLCLELDHKCQLPPEDPTETEKLFIETKELIIKKLTSLKGRSLKESLEDGEHPDISTNLMRLELSGMVKSSDDYSAIIESIISDTTQKQQYNKQLTKDTRTLSCALERLKEKKKYYEDQLTYYEQYLNTCLSSLSKSSRIGERKIKKAKYSANQLLEKGVLVSLDGVPSSQLKNVQFEIVATEIKGVYSVRGRFMGVEVDKINIDVQDLLKHQFEGQPILDLFGKAKINVNLLLHLLNKKFHTRA